jgi:ribosome maturation factor RimP
MAQRQGRGGRRSGAPGADNRLSSSDGRRSGGPGRDDRRLGGAGDAGATRARLREIIEPVVESDGYDLEGLSVSRAGRRHLVRLTVDGDGGVNLDAVAAISRRVGVAFDAIEDGGEVLFAGEYELEVSSPGVDRPLTLPRHWRRSVGRLVQVKAAQGQVTGRVLSADDDGVVLDVDGRHHELPYAELGPGKIQLEFARIAQLSDAELETMLDPVAEDDDTDDADVGAVIDGDEEEEDEE